MLAYLAGDGLTRMVRGLQRLARPRTWMEPLLEQGVVIVHDHNRANLMMGRSFTGAPFKPVKRKHGGPPLLRKEYRAINLAVVDAAQLSRNTFEIRLSWPQFKSAKGRDILSMHMRPYRNRPARPAVGIATSAVDEFVAAGRRYLGREFRELTNQANVDTSPKPGFEQFSGRITGRR